MSTEFTIRDAEQREAADLAMLDNLASHGMSLWFWQGAVMQGKARDAYEFGRERFAKTTNFFGYSNARVAENASGIMGAATAYLMPEPDDDPIREIDHMKPLFELFDKAQGMWFLDSLAVYRQHLRRGVGRALLNDFLSRGAQQKFEQAALVAEDSNIDALKLYETAGFTEQSRKPYLPFNSTSNSQNWLLFTKPIH